MTALFVRDAQSDPVLASYLKERSEQGNDYFDEAWEGVLHMLPPPHGGHQVFQVELLICLREQAKRHSLGRIVQLVGMRETCTPAVGPKANYRSPDLALVPFGYPFDKPDESGWLEDGIPLVVEVRSPREVVVEKLGFYADRGVQEVLYVGWKDRVVALFSLGGGRVMEVSPDREGFVLVRSLDVRIRRVRAGDVTHLEIEDARGGGPLPQV